MIINCDISQREEIKSILCSEMGKMAIDFKIIDSADGLEIHTIFPYDIDEDIEFIVPNLKHNNNGVCKGPAELFSKIKEQYSDVVIEGHIEIGNDNNRNYCYFYSPENSIDVSAEFDIPRVFEDEDNPEEEPMVPFSKCWFPFLTYNDYGIEATGFVSKEEFATFIEDATEYASEEDMTIEELIESDMIGDFLSDNDYPYPVDEDHLIELYKGALSKYEEE